MAIVQPKDRVKEVSSTVGAGSYQLGGASAGFSSFLSSYGAGNLSNIPYSAVEENGSWEVGFGTFSSAGNQLSRDLILSNSLGTTAAVNWAAGTRNIFVSHPALEAVFRSENLAGLPDTSEALDNLGGGTVGKVSFAAGDAASGRAAIQAVGTGGGDTITGALTINGLLTAAANIETTRITLAGDTTAIVIENVAGGVVHATNDGNGRYSQYWNVEPGDHDAFFVGAENATRTRLHADEWGFYLGDGSVAGGGDPISWEEVFQVSQTEMRWRGSQLIPIGTKMVFVQASAPSGWTLDSALNDRVLTVVNTTGGVTGGSWTISGLTGSTTVDDHVLTENEMPIHNHHNAYYGSPAALSAVGSTVFLVKDYDAADSPTALNTGNEGFDGAHAHTASTTIPSDATWRPLNVSSLACVKD